MSEEEDKDIKDIELPTLDVFNVEIANIKIKN